MRSPPGRAGGCTRRCRDRTSSGRSAPSDRGHRPGDDQDDPVGSGPRGSPPAGEQGQDQAEAEVEAHVGRGPQHRDRQAVGQGAGPKALALGGAGDVEEVVEADEGGRPCSW